MPLLEQVMTGFIAGVTIVFGLVASAVVETLVAPDLGPGVGRLAGAAAFGIGLVFLVVGRSELFSENFFDPVATTIERPDRHHWLGLLRLWPTILLLNLVGGAILVALLSVEGALPAGSHETLVRVAEEVAAKGWGATFVRAVFAGALISLLSYLLAASDTVTDRILLSYMVGFVLALGPFDHVVVSALHLLFGALLSGTVGVAEIGLHLVPAVAGNLVGGVVLVTLTHAAQAKTA
jgi:formate-nitrite transporter family protein